MNWLTFGLQIVEVKRNYRVWTYFCGEPNDKLGGMHFVGRYVEAQEDKWAVGILCNESDIKPPVYTFGMKYLGKDGEVKVKCPNGYAYNLHADNFCN